MNPPNHTASTHAELALKIELGTQLIAYRPAAHAESGSWKRIDEDTEIGLTDPCTLRIRLLAQDPGGELVMVPAWSVSAATRLESGTWQSLPDRSAPAYDHLTDELVISTAPRTYRFTVALQDSNLSTTFELVIAELDPDAGSTGHDIIFDPDGDLKPPPEPVGGPPSVPNSLSATG